MLKYFLVDLKGIRSVALSIIRPAFGTSTSVSGVPTLPETISATLLVPEFWKYMFHDDAMHCALPAFCEGKSLATDGFPSQKANIAERRLFIWC